MPKIPLTVKSTTPDATILRIDGDNARLVLDAINAAITERFEAAQAPSSMEFLESCVLRIVVDGRRHGRRVLRHAWPELEVDALPLGAHVSLAGLEAPRRAEVASNPKRDAFLRDDWRPRRAWDF